MSPGPSARILVGCIAVLALSCGATTGKKSAELKIELANDTLTVNRVPLQLPTQRPVLFQLLGKPDRETALANTILTWDELGIYAYESRVAKSIDEVDIAFAVEEFTFCPKKTFSGSLVVEGATIRADSSIAAINQSIKSKFVYKYAGSWKLVQKKHTLYLHEHDGITTKPPKKDGLTSLAFTSSD